MTKFTSNYSSTFKKKVPDPRKSLKLLIPVQKQQFHQFLILYFSVVTVPGDREADNFTFLKAFKINLYSILGRCVTKKLYAHGMICPLGIPFYLEI